MEHLKLYHVETVPLGERCLVVEGPVPPGRLSELTMHPDLDAFRRPKDQHEALIEIAGLAEGRIIITREENVIVGYVTFHYPDEQERWSQGHMEDLIELGAIEVANDSAVAGPRPENDQNRLRRRANGTIYRVHDGILLALGFKKQWAERMGLPQNDGTADEGRRHGLVRDRRSGNLLASGQLPYGPDRPGCSDFVEGAVRPHPFPAAFHVLAHALAKSIS